MNMGIAYDSKGDYNKALQFYETGILPSRFVGDAWGQTLRHPALSLNNMANACAAKGNTRKARDGRVRQSRVNCAGRARSGPSLHPAVCRQLATWRARVLVTQRGLVLCQQCYWYILGHDVIYKHAIH